MSTRTFTPDERHHDGSRTIHMKRACNGCGTYVGDVTEQELDCAVEGKPLPDVRGECAHCATLVALEAAGCTTWLLTPRSYPRVDHDLDRLGIFAKAYTQAVDGKVTTVGMRIGIRPSHVVARFGDWIVRHPDGRVTVHAAPAAGEVSRG